MSEIERRLRAAMHAAVDDIPAPAGLLERVRARRRRRRARAAAAVAALAVLAVPAAALGLRGGAVPGAAPGLAPAGSGRPGAARPGAVRAAPGTVLDGCSRQIGEDLGPDWRKQSVRAGPLWFIDLRQQRATSHGRSPAAVGGLAVAVQNDARAWVTAAGTSRSYFRFLFGPGDFRLGVDGDYTVADGEAGVTFVGCAAGQAPSFQSEYTLYGGYYLVAGTPRRVALDVWTPGSRRPTLITFMVGR
jgi:hypothetical protein